MASAGATTGAFVLGCGLPIGPARAQATVVPGTRVPAFRKSARGLGIAKDISGQISLRPDKRFATYVYADMAVGAARLEEAKLVEIVCL